ncbi:hypothetical protein AGMMS49928_03560 [Spirochaetia bacterium]|nr:hypothetical protein AGMMS49928_03560 [Spirochaetia bacterium]
MITIKAALDGEGLLRSCQVSGHAGAGKRGEDIVCAAVSVLTRTALRTLSKKTGVIVRGEAPQRGLFRMETDYSGEGREFLAAAGVFLLEGLSSVAEEFPEFCTMTIDTERRN